MANTAFLARNGLNVNNFFTVNNTIAAAGANVLISATDFKVANSTVNAALTIDRLTVLRANATLLSAVDNGSAGVTANGAANAYFSLKVSAAHGIVHIANTTGFFVNAPDGVNTYTYSSNLTIFVGANVSVDHTTLKLGNSTVNSVANSTILRLANSTVSTNVAQGGVAVGTSIVNATSFAAGANVVISTVDVKLGNSTVNTTANSVIVTLSNSTVTANLSTAGVALGANVLLNVSELKIGNTSVNTYINSSSMSISGTNVMLQGKHTVWVPAVAMISRTTNGAASGTAEMTTNKNMFNTLDFDTTTQEFAQFAIRMPKSWDESTITVQFVWSHASTTTNFGVVWGCRAVALSNDDAGDVAFGTGQDVADTGGTTNDIYITDPTSAITIAGTPQAEDYVMFEVYRAPANGSDTMAVDARLHGVTVYITVHAGNDV